MEKNTSSILNKYTVDCQITSHIGSYLVTDGTGDNLFFLPIFAQRLHRLQREIVITFPLLSVNNAGGTTAEMSISSDRIGINVMGFRNEKVIFMLKLLFLLYAMMATMLVRSIYNTC